MDPSEGLTTSEPDIGGSGREGALRPFKPDWRLKKGRLIQPPNLTGPIDCQDLYCARLPMTPHARRRKYASIAFRRDMLSRHGSRFL